MPADAMQIGWISVAVAMVAALYASVGHGGASGYLAVMALMSFPASTMKTSALMLNLLVAGISAIQYYRAGFFRFHLLWPFLLTSIPMSYAGALLRISPKTYGLILAATLIWTGVRLVIAPSPTRASMERNPLPRVAITFLIGSVIGLVSGMVGVGGGIFLSPLFILCRWADPKETAAVSATFVWLNSAAGLIGHAHTAVEWPEGWICYAAAAAAGGVIGSRLGVRRFSNMTLRRLLASVLLLAAVKSILTVVKVEE